MLHPAILRRRLRSGGSPLALYAADGFVPALVADFANDRYLGTISSLDDLSSGRTGEATYIDSTGTRQTAATGVVRTDSHLPIATPVWRHSAGHCSIPDQTNASYTGAMYRTLHTAAVAIENLKLVYGNWYYANETTGTMSLRIGIEYPLGSTPVRLYWGGEETVDIEPNENAVSDALSISIPAGAEFAIRTWQDNKTGGIISSSSHSTAKTIRLSLTNGTDADDETLTNDTSGSNVTAALVPIAILSEHNEPAVMLVGDSLFRGAHDDNSAGAQGWAERHLYAENAAFSNFSKAGSSVAAYVAEAGTNRVGQAAVLAGYFTHVLCDYGTNDIAAGRSATLIQDDLETMQGTIGLPLVQTTIMHRTSSTDSWATTVNQTQITFPSEVDALNTALRGGLDFIDSVVDVQAIAQPSTVWEANWTSDGVHPNETGVVGILAGLSAGDTIPIQSTKNYTWSAAGALIEPAGENLLHTTDALVTQSVTVTAAPHTLSFRGLGSVTLSGVSTAGPLQGAGTRESDRVSLTFTPTAGPLTLTVAGSVVDAQLEVGSVKSSYIPNTAGSGTSTRNADTLTGPSAKMPALGDHSSILWVGTISYADLDETTASEIFDWYGDTANWWKANLSTGGVFPSIGSGGVDFNNRYTGTTKRVQSFNAFSPGDNVDIRVAMRAGVDLLQGATNGAATAEASGVANFPDLSSSDLELSNAPRLPTHIKRVVIWDVDIGESGITEATS